MKIVFCFLNKSYHFLIRLVVFFFSWFYSSLALVLGSFLFLFFRHWDRNEEFDLRKIRKVLILRFDKIGDAVMCTPFLRELRRNLPHAKITLLVNSLVYNLMECCPYVDEVMNIGRSGESALNILMSPLGKFFFGLRYLWRKNFDLAIVPRWDVDLSQAAFLAYFSGAHWRAGYSEKVIGYKSWSNKGYDRLFTHICRDASLKHEVERPLEMIRFLGGKVESEDLELWVKKEDELFIDQLFNTSGIPPENSFIVFCPGATLPKRTWPLKNFIDLGNWLKEAFPCTLFVIGGKKEWQAGKELSSKVGNLIINLAGQLSLRQTYALLKRTHLYIGNNTGSIHMASAADLPVIEISCHPKSGSPFIAPAPERVGPWAEKKIILQPKNPLPPCNIQCDAKAPHCITQITVQHVESAVEKLLGKIH